jgi:hypothetical protein
LCLALLTLNAFADDLKVEKENPSSEIKIEKESYANINEATLKDFSHYIQKKSALIKKLGITSINISNNNSKTTFKSGELNLDIDGKDTTLDVMKRSLDFHLFSLLQSTKEIELFANAEYANVSMKDLSLLAKIIKENTSRLAKLGIKKVVISNHNKIYEDQLHLAGDNTTAEKLLQSFDFLMTSKEISNDTKVTIIIDNEYAKISDQALPAITSGFEERSYKIITSGVDKIRLTNHNASYDCANCKDGAYISLNAEENQIDKMFSQLDLILNNLETYHGRLNFKYNDECNISNQEFEKFYAYLNSIIRKV